MDTVTVLPITPEKQARLQALAQKREAQNASDAQHGKEALEAFGLSRREKLSLADRETVAGNLWYEIQEIKRSGRGELGKVLEIAEISGNHLSKRLILAPHEADSSALRAHPAPYIDLLAALAKHTGEAVELLADRILLGTHFHPESLADLREAQLILEALQVAVDRIDREFNLWEQCQAVAAIRKPLEEPYYQALRDNDQATLSDFLDANPLHVIGDPIKLWWPIDHELWDWDAGTALAPVNPFWARPYATQGSSAAAVWSGEEFFFFPHIYLGPTIEWSGWREYVEGMPQTLSPSSKKDILAQVQSESEPQVRFDGDKYEVYEDDPESGEKRHIGGPGGNWGEGTHMDNAARWLVIYPDPDAKRLVPAIYMRGTYSVTELIPLSARLIAEFGDSSLWHYAGRDGAQTLLERLRKLTGFGTGDFKAMDAWRETAARFDLNPIFRSHPDEAKKVLYRRHLERWIAENRLPAGASAIED